MTDRIRKLAIVGASARAAAFSAIRAGYEVVAADLFADADLARVAQAARIHDYPAGLADWLAATECDAWMYTGALENHARLVDQMAALRPLLGNSGGVLRQARDPLQLQQELGDAGLSFPETTASSVGLPLDGSWLCKTYRHAGGIGVWSLRRNRQLMRAERECAVFQRYVDGEPAAAVFVVFEEHSELLGVTRQLLGANDGGSAHWAYRGSMAMAGLNSDIKTQLDKLGETLAKRFHLRGLVGVDLVLDANRAWVIEINPRYTASVEIVEQASGVAAIAAHVAACTGVATGRSTTSSPSSDGLTHGKLILFARRDVVVTDAFFRWAIERTGVEAEKRELADLPAAGERISAGSPVLTVFASGRDCEQRLNERLAEVENRLYAAQ